MNMHDVLVSNIGFGNASGASLEKLRNSSNVLLNDAGIRYTENDFISKIGNATVLIAGTEKITRAVLDSAKNLALIARVGVGVDNIDLDYAKHKKINISYTPDAPSSAMPEFTLGLILNLIKQLSISDRKMHQGTWYRPMGSMLGSLKIGIVGAGKIGSKVIQLIRAVAPEAAIFYQDPYIAGVTGAQKCDFETLFKTCDLVSLHMPLNDSSRGLVDEKLLYSMKQGSYLVNTSRGGIVDEMALYKALKNNHLAGAALDVFETEPYQGPLIELDNCLLSSHIGSLTQEVRAMMEEQVVEDVLRFINNKPLLRPLMGFNFCE